MMLKSKSEINTARAVRACAAPAIYTWSELACKQASLNRIEH